jgi:O-antigen/teichoic acid export membrane protein
VVPIAVLLVTVPVYLKIIGLDRYGLLTICWILVGYFGLFDLGIGRATAQKLAQIGDAGAELRSKAFWVGASISLALALLAIVVAIPLLPLLLNFIQVRSSALHGEISSAVPMLVLAVPIAIIQSVLRGALEGRREFFIVNLALATAAIATAGMPLLAAEMWGPELQHLVAASLLARGGLLAVLAIACRVKIPVGAYKVPSITDIKSAVRFGSWLTVTNIIGPVMVVVDRFFIGAALGPAAVAIYAIPLNIVNQLILVPGALANAMFPRLATANPADALNRRALFVASFFVTVSSSAAVVLIGPFLALWIGGATAQKSTDVALILIVGAWANGLAQIPHVSLQALGRTDVAAKVHLAEVVPYLLILWYALSYLGIIGAAIAWSVRCVVDFVVLAWFDGSRGRVLRRTSVQGLLVLTLSAVALTAGSVPTLRWVGMATIMAAVCGYLYWIIPPEWVQTMKVASRRR